MITSILPYFGGKRTLAPRIVAELGPHAAYFEPFCGSLAVVMAKPVAGHETVNDLNGDLVNLVMVIASDRWQELYERCVRTLYSEDLFLAHRDRMAECKLPVPCSPADVTDDHIERALDTMVVGWVGRHGTAGTRRYNYQMAIRWTPNGGGGALRWRNAVESLHAWHDRMRDLVILHRDGIKLIGSIEDHPQTAIYCDPPYLQHTRSGSKYLVDFDPDDHARLAQALQRFARARVVVSYYADPILAELYPTDCWTHIDIPTQKNLHVQNRRGQGKCDVVERLIVNGPVLSEHESSLWTRRRA